jgi:hypothetical protein
MSRTGESPIQTPYGWLADPSHLPRLNEVQAAQLTEEGREAVNRYYQPPFGPERFEVWTEEYITELSNHIVRTLYQSESVRERDVVLEVGAGDGRLAGLLGERIHEEGLGALVVATDIEPPEDTHFPVEALNHREALAKYDPVAVISSWMPQYEEWTWDMRATPSVEEYIVIGVPPLTGNRSTWRGYASPEIGEFKPVQLHHLDALKTGQFSDYKIPYLSLTRGFHRVSEAQPEV